MTRVSVHVVSGNPLPCAYDPSPKTSYVPTARRSVMVLVGVTSPLLDPRLSISVMGVPVWQWVPPWS